MCPKHSEHIQRKTTSQLAHHNNTDNNTDNWNWKDKTFSCLHRNHSELNLHSNFPQSLRVTRLLWFLFLFCFIFSLGRVPATPPQHDSATFQHTGGLLHLQRHCGFVCFTTLVLHYCSCLDSERPPWKPQPIHRRPSFFSFFLKVRVWGITYLVMKWLDCYRSHHSFITISWLHLHVRYGTRIHELDANGTKIDLNYIRYVNSSIQADMCRLNT